ncbi:MAG TPA: dipeptidase PepV [Ruminiclostridium sp.]|nr:dipeptidase PepV [Ruminiclostridium sp.]
MKNISGQMQKYKDELLEDIVHIVNIPSFREAPKDGMPFGEGPAKALEFCLNLAENMGFKVRNVDGRAGHIEYGEGEDLVGILAHCDVVPAGTGWTKKPYSGEVCGNRIYGRGTMDDKGPAIAAIYCLKALKDLGIKPKKRIRVIIGASEEEGMEDMEYYFAHEEMPELAFSPDSEYPICNREKGILHLSLETEKNDGSVLKFKSGSAVNIVPVEADAFVSSEDKETVQKVANDFKNDECKFSLSELNGGVTINCSGKAAHASVPEEGINAAGGLVRLLCSIFGAKSGTLLKFLNDMLTKDIYGERLGIKSADEPSGSLTVNLGVVDIENSAKALIDIRYPVTGDGGKIFSKVKSAAGNYGVKASLLLDNKPLFIKENDELILKLKHAYKTATGNDAELYSTGGGTYARMLKNGAAFGAGMKPLSYYNIHGADEFLEIDDFMKHCEICLQAIYELSC